MQGKITLIMPKTKLERKKRVGAYARVSSAKDAMLHSLSYQVSYYSDYIQKHNEWEYVGVYVDEGISGTKDSRDNFNRMIEDAKLGKIDLIITKSISRFARNTIIFLETIRALKEFNVDVFFEEQNIHSLSGDGEFMLTILASYAQEEAKSVSENMKWRIKKNFEEGKIWSAKILGYRAKNGKFIIEPKEAEVVKRIYDLYLNGLSIHRITRLLNEEHVRTRDGDHFVYSAVRNILKNYNYTGNLILQKTYRLDYVSKKTKINNGEKTKYIVEDSHEAIVDLETFNKVQEMFKHKTHSKVNTGRNNRYIFSGLIKCECCGQSYKRTMNCNKPIWICRTYVYFGTKGCESHQIRESILYEASCKALGIESFDEAQFKENVDYISSKDRTLTFRFKDGTTTSIGWKNPSRSKSWTPEMKEQARIRAITIIRGEKK